MKDFQKFLSIRMNRVRNYIDVANARKLKKDEGDNSEEIESEGSSAENTKKEENKEQILHMS